MQPVLMVGCGGSGTKVVRHVREAVKRRLLEIDWEGDIPDCWRFLGIDTPTAQEASSEIPPLPSQDYLSIGSKHRSYPDLFRALESQAGDSAHSGLQRSLLSGWLPDPSRASVPLSKGAGQCRAIGRSAALDAFPRAVSDMIRSAFQDIRGARPDLDKVTRALGYEVSGDIERTHQDPLVLVCSSVGGGTGAGIALDVVDLLRAIDPAGAHPVLALFANDIFELETREALAANSLAFISEMLAAYWSQEEQIESPLAVARTTQNLGSGPHSVFLISKEQHEGAAFGSTSEVYLAAGETLSTWVTSEVVQEEIVDFLVANWQNYAGLNAGGYPFGMNHQDGAVSSFGVAKVSVGRDRFARWAEHKLARAAMELLIQGHLRLRVHRDSRLTDEDWIEELGQRHAEAVYTASGVSNSGNGGMASTEEFFASAQAASEHVAYARRELMGAIPPGASMSASALHEHIKNRASRVRTSLIEDIGRDALIAWRNDVVADTSRAVSEIAAVASLPVAVSAVESARLQHNQKSAADLMDRAGAASSEYQRLVEEGLSVLRQSSGSLNAESDLFAQAVEKIAAGLVQSWRSARLEEAGNLMAHADGELYDELLNCLRSASREIARSLEDEEVSEWPKADEMGISVKYHPSAIELPLEDHGGWARQLQALCSDAVDRDIPYGELPIDPVRYRMVAGDRDTIPSLLHFRDGASWSPGLSAPIDCKAAVGEWTERFRSWANKPGSNYRRYVMEGMGDYLSPTDKYTQQRRPDHPDRIAKFRECLLAARGRSNPMMRISSEMHHAVHGKHPKESYIRQAFPFKDGEPAADVVTEVVGEMGDEWYSSLIDMPSVMLISYFDSPVHPLVVRSFTEPISAALNSYQGADKRAHGFWQWRRSRRLDAFIPLPRVSLEHMIRGFAIARLCGLMTADIDHACRIVSLNDGRTPSFPWPLLSQPSSRADILAALLESFSLCFGAANTDDQEEVLSAYRVLHDIGEAHVSNHRADVLRRVIREGTHCLSLTVDTPYINGPDEGARRAAAEKYLTNQVSRFKRCLVLNEQDLQTRDRAGMSREMAPTGELADIYIPIYQDVLDRLLGPDQGDDEV